MATRIVLIGLSVLFGLSAQAELSANTKLKWRYLVEPKFEHVESFSEGLAAVREQAQGPYGYINLKGNEVIASKYYSVSNFKDGLAWVGTDATALSGGTSWGPKIFLIDTKGEVKKTIRPVGERLYPRWEIGSTGEEGMTRVYYHDYGSPGSYVKAGYLTRDGIVIGYDNWCEAGEFKDGVARVRLSGLRGCDADYHMINSDFEWVGDKHHFISNVNDDYAVVGGPRFFGFMHKWGTYLSKLIYDEAQPFHEGLAQVKEDGRWKYISGPGQTSFEVDRDYISLGALGNMSEAMAWWAEGMNGYGGYEKYIALDRANRVVFTIKLGDRDGGMPVSSFNGGLAVLQVDPSNCDEDTSREPHLKRCYAYINTRGEFAYPERYNFAKPFDDGLAIVGTKGKKGLIYHRDGKFVVPPIFDEIGELVHVGEGNSVAWVKDGEKYGYIVVGYERD